MSNQKIKDYTTNPYKAVADYNYVNLMDFCIKYLPELYERLYNKGFRPEDYSPDNTLGGFIKMGVEGYLWYSKTIKN